LDFRIEVFGFEGAVEVPYVRLKSDPPSYPNNVASTEEFGSEAR